MNRKTILPYRGALHLRGILVMEQPALRHPGRSTAIVAGLVLLVTGSGLTHAALPGPALSRPSLRSIAGYEVVVAETPVDSTSEKQLQAYCPDGKKALGAGWSVLDPTSAYLEGAATASEPSYDGSSWLVNAKNLDTAFAPEWKLRIRLICATLAD